MLTHFDRAYYEARLRQNQRLAAEAGNAGIRAIHLQYVRMYQKLLEPEEQEQGLGGDVESETEKNMASEHDMKP